MDRVKLLDLLARAPREERGQFGTSVVIMELPWPNGGWKTVHIEEAVIVGAGLKARCPDVRTYRGRTADRSVYAQFEWGPSGFRAIVSSNNRQVHIVPYSLGDTEHYIVYYSRDRVPVSVPRPETAPMDTRPPATGASPANSDAPRSSEESIEIRRGCYGCENRYKLTFRLDGTAILTRTGLLTEHTCQGSVKPEDVSRLASLIRSEGFFDMNEDYLDPRFADGEGLTTSAILDGRRKKVGHRDRVGPAGLKAIENAIHELGEGIAWAGTRR